MDIIQVNHNRLYRTISLLNVLHNVLLMLAMLTLLFKDWCTVRLVRLSSPGIQNNLVFRSMEV